MMSFNCIVESPVGLGMGPSLCEANCDRLFVSVAGLTVRCAGGVVVKNGWANRNGVDFVVRDLAAFAGAAFWTRRLGLLDFLAIDLSPKNLLSKATPVKTSELIFRFPARRLI